MDAAADPMLPIVNSQGPDGEDSLSEFGGVEFHHTTFWACREADGAFEARNNPVDLFCGLSVLSRCDWPAHHAVERKPRIGGGLIRSSFAARFACGGEIRGRKERYTPA